MEFDGFAQITVRALLKALAGACDARLVATPGSAAKSPPGAPSGLPTAYFPGSWHSDCSRSRVVKPVPNVETQL